MISKNIKYSLLEIQEKKRKKIIESKLIKKRISFIVESTSNAYNQNLSKRNKVKLLFAVVEEFNSIKNTSLLSENLRDIFKTIFGETAFGGVFKNLFESLVSGVLSKMGVKDTNLINTIMSHSSDDSNKLLDALSTCETFTKYLSEAVAEAFVIKTQQDSEGNILFDKIKEVLSTEIKNPEIISKIEESLKESVCDIYEQFSSKADEVLNALKGLGKSTNGEIQLQ